MKTTYEKAVTAAHKEALETLRAVGPNITEAQLEAVHQRTQRALLEALREAQMRKGVRMGRFVLPLDTLGDTLSALRGYVVPVLEARERAQMVAVASWRTPEDAVTREALAFTEQEAIRFLQDLRGLLDTALDHLTSTEN